MSDLSRMAANRLEQAFPGLRFARIPGAQNDPVPWGVAPVQAEGTLPDGSGFYFRFGNDVATLQAWPGGVEDREAGPPASVPAVHAVVADVTGDYFAGWLTVDQAVTVFTHLLAACGVRTTTAHPAAPTDTSSACTFVSAPQSPFAHANPHSSEIRISAWEADQVRQMSTRFIGISRGSGLVPIAITHTPGDGR